MFGDVIMIFSEKDLAVENFNFAQFDNNLTLVRFCLHISSFIIAAILWIKFDFSFYYVAITLIIFFNVVCMIYNFLPFYNAKLFFKFLNYNKKILYNFAKLYPIILLIAVYYFIKNIISFYSMNINNTDYVIGILSIFCLVCMYRYKKDYEVKVQSIDLEDNNYIGSEDEETLLKEEKFEMSPEDNANNKNDNLLFSEREKIDDTENKEEAKINAQNCTNFVDSKNEETVIKNEQVEILSNNNDNDKNDNLVLSEQEKVDNIENKEEVKINTPEDTNFIDSKNVETVLKNEEIKTVEEEKIACTENKENVNVTTQLNEQKNSATKQNKKKNMKFIFYKLFSNIIPVEKAKDLPFKKFYKLLCDTYKGQTVTIEHINFIFEKNKFYRLNAKKEKIYYKPKSIKTFYSLFRNNKLI